MRVPAALFVVATAAPVTGALAFDTHEPAASPASHCPRTAGHLADSNSRDQVQPLTPRKLAELSPATAYMAVYRRIAGCEAPLTMSNYRNPRRR